MPQIQADELGDIPLSYAMRREKPSRVLVNRVGVTSLLFGLGMALSVALGRPRG